MPKEGNNDSNSVKNKINFFKDLRTKNMGIDLNNVSKLIPPAVTNNNVIKNKNFNSIVPSLVWNIVKNYITTPVLNLIQKKINSITEKHGLSIINFVHRAPYIGLGHIILKQLITKTTWGSILYFIYEFSNLNSSVNNILELFNNTKADNGNKNFNLIMDNSNESDASLQINSPFKKIFNIKNILESISLFTNPLSSLIINKNLFKDTFGTLINVPTNSDKIIIIERNNDLTTINNINTSDMELNTISSQNIELLKNEGYSVYNRTDLDDNWFSEISAVCLILGISYYKFGPDVTISSVIIYTTYRTLNMFFSFTPLPPEWVATTSLIIGTSFGASYYIYKKYKNYKSWTQLKNNQENINDES